MIADYQLEDTLYLPFTTRAFSTGVPTALVSGAVDIYEDVTATPIVTGETLSVSLNSVVGFNMITVTATAATGFEAGKSYTAILQAGTVDSVSVVGEVVAHFTIDKSAAAKDLANATDGLGALKALIDTVDTVVDAIKVKTDSLTFTVANQVDANTLSVGGTTQTAGDLQALITTVDTVADGIQTDLSNGTDGLGALKTLIDTVDTVVDAIKAKTDSLTFTVASQVDANTIAISGDTAAADNLEASTETIVTGSVSAGTHTTALIDASDVTGQGDDTFIGRVLIFRTGTLQFEAGVITDFASATGQITFAASTWTVAPTSGDTFVIV